MASSATGAEMVRRPDVVRTSIIIDRVLDQNLSVWCTKSGTSRGDAIRVAISEFLRTRGMQPDREPKIDFSYE